MLSAQDSALLLRRSIVTLRFSKSLVETNASLVSPWSVSASISPAFMPVVIKKLAIIKNNTTATNCFNIISLQFVAILPKIYSKVKSLPLLFNLEDI